MEWGAGVGAGAAVETAEVIVIDRGRILKDWRKLTSTTTSINLPFEEQEWPLRTILWTFTEVNPGIVILI